MANTGKYTRTPLERCPILPEDGKVGSKVVTSFSVADPWRLFFSADHS